MTARKPKRRLPDRRSAILAEAMLMLGEYGFNGLTVQALAERCQISNAGLLYYFGTKEQLFLEVVSAFELRERQTMQPLIAAAEACRHDRDRAGPAMLDLFRQIVAGFAKRPDDARFLVMLQSEALDPKHLAHAWFADREALTLDMLTLLLDGIVPDPQSRGRKFVSLMHGLLRHWLWQDMRFDLIAEWESTVMLLLADARASPG